MEQKFLDIVQKMDLSHLETAALRLAIARDDSSVRLAIDNYRADLDDAQLMETLRLISRITIQETMDEQEREPSATGAQSASTDDDDEEEDDDDDGDDDEEEQERELKEMRKQQAARRAAETNGKRAAESSSPQQQQQQRAYPAQYYESKRGDSSDSEESSEEEDDEDVDEDGAGGASSSLMTSQAARNHVFPILVTELVRESILPQQLGELIVRRFSEGSPVISAALDVYDRDSDLAQLVTTLQSVR